MSSRTVLTALSFVIGLVLGATLVLVGLEPVSDARAQQTRSPAPIGAAAPVAVAPGPGGMWIVYGNRLRVCVAGALPAGVEPFTPECGEPVALY